MLIRLDNMGQDHYVSGWTAKPISYFEAKKRKANHCFTRSEYDPSVTYEASDSKMEMGADDKIMIIRMPAETN